VQPHSTPLARIECRHQSKPPPWHSQQRASSKLQPAVRWTESTPPSAVLPLLRCGISQPEHLPCHIGGTGIPMSARPRRALHAWQKPAGPAPPYSLPLVPKPLRRLAIALLAQRTVCPSARAKVFTGRRNARAANLRAHSSEKVVAGRAHLGQRRRSLIAAAATDGEAQENEAPAESDIDQAQDDETCVWLRV